jgi:hypothetical protein
MQVFTVKDDCSELDILVPTAVDRPARLFIWAPDLEDAPKDDPFPNNPFPFNTHVIFPAPREPLECQRTLLQSALEAQARAAAPAHMIAQSAHRTPHAHTIRKTVQQIVLALQQQQVRSRYSMACNPSMAS